MITREFPPRSGGIGYYVYYLSKKLRERGHETTVITRGSAGKTVKKVVQQKFPTLKQELSSLRSRKVHSGCNTATVVSTHNWSLEG